MAPRCVLGYTKPLHSAVHPGTEGAAHHREGDASELSLASYSLIVIAVVLEVSLWWNMLNLSVLRKHELWQYNIFRMYNFPVEVLCSFVRLSLVITMFWKVMDKYIYFVQGFNLLLNPQVASALGSSPAPGSWFSSGCALTGHLSLLGYSLTWSTVRLCCQTSALVQLKIGSH